MPVRGEFDGPAVAGGRPLLLFVYGTLKAGFPNGHLNPGRRLGGVYRTRARLPLFVVRLPNEDRAPWLVDTEGQGHQVRGEVYEVDSGAFDAVDAFEEVGQPTGYVRVQIDLEAADASTDAPLRAFAYLKPAHHLDQCLAREGPLEEYTLGHAAGYWLTVPVPAVGQCEPQPQGALRP